MSAYFSGLHTACPTDSLDCPFWLSKL